MFSDSLKALRKERKLSQRVLAEQLSVSQQSVCKWEGGASTPDPDVLRKIADIFDVSLDRLLGREQSFAPVSESGEMQIPVIGTVRAGYNALAFQEDYGTEPANVRNPTDHFYLIVTGDSMEPRISNGDLALVHRQPDVESGTLAVVLVDNEEGTLKKVIKRDGAIILQPFNQAYQAQIYMGEELSRIQVVGKVIETKTKW